MNFFDNQIDLKAYLSEISDPKSTIGFVPTMGALHAGHLSLMKQSLRDNSISVVSIFVNPTQFNNQLDLEKYPRTLENDIKIIKSLSEKIIVYAPTVADVYETDVKSFHFCFDGLENQMEGKFRPGHFDGVGTVVKKLFEIVSPKKAYFGEKDFQQLQIIKKLVEKNNLNVQIIGCPIAREANGLAMSSRNERLMAGDRQAASIIFETLEKAKKQFQKLPIQVVKDMVTKTFFNNSTFKLEYFEIAKEATLESIQPKSARKQYRGFIAVFCGDVRLIDTMKF
jgi:pantoate--beta-alanine ligase